MPAAHPVLDRVLNSPGDCSWALLWREEGPQVEVLVGQVHDVAALADIPTARQDQPVLAMVPYRQIAERGFDAHDDGAPLRVLVVTEREAVSVDDVIAALPTDPVPLTDQRVSVSDGEYAEIVTRVIEDEIGNGEG